MSGSSTSRVATRELLPDDYPAWEALVAASTQGSPYALPAYLSALCRAGDAAFRIVGVFLDGILVGGVPLFERRCRSGVYVANRTLLYYNGPVLLTPPRKFPADATALEVQLLEALAVAVEAMGYAHVHLHSPETLRDLRPFLARGWRASLSYTYRLRLDDTAALWDRISPDLKRLIARCEREGVHYREDDDIDSLFALHFSTHQRKGAPLYLSEDRFRAFGRALTAASLARVAHAVFDGKVIASQLVLTGSHRVAHTVCAGADEEHLRLGASAFLRWHNALSLARHGYVSNDLTDAALNPVTRFKSQLGAELTRTWSVARTASRMYALESAVRNWRSRTGRQRKAIA